MRFPVLSMAAAAVLVPALASAQTVVTDPQLQATTQQILTVEQQQLAVAKQQLVVLDTIEALLQAQATPPRRRKPWPMATVSPRPRKQSAHSKPRSKTTPPNRRRYIYPFLAGGDRHRVRERIPRQRRGIFWFHP